MKEKILTLMYREQMFICVLTNILQVFEIIQHVFDSKTVL